MGLRIVPTRVQFSKNLLLYTSESVAWREIYRTEGMQNDAHSLSFISLMSAPA